MNLSRFAGWLGLLALATSGRVFAAALLPVGLARVEINPTEPIRLMGYASRHTESTNVHSAIHARALALGAGADVAVLLTADNCILPGAITATVRARLQAVAGVAPERVAISVSHTHNAPTLAGAAPNLFVEDIPPNESRHIQAYTRFFTDQLVAVALSALSNRQPARVAWGVGRVGFAANRRTPGGPVDHDVPLLRILSPEGVVRGVLLNYACHCTTLGDFNQTHPDWNGVCARELEAAWPGAVALVAIGCGADANPDPRGTLALVERHGGELAREAGALVRQDLTEITNAPRCRLETIQLPFQTHFTREQWAARATNSGIVGYHARKWLARVDRGEVPSPTLPYPVQTWVFGDTLAMVFLGGEVVVDYSLRLKQELDPRRLWVNGYVNDVPCYIPSRRILREGGYEAESSLWYYDRPQQLAPGIEDLIVQTVREQLPASFLADAGALQHPPPREPEASLQVLRTRPGLRVDLVAGDDLVQSPVALDFGADGSLWVAEMRDYPEGLDGKGQPGGRIVRLMDTDGDGRFDQSEIWADDLPFPTGLMAWGDGVLVGAAPDIVWLQPVPGAGAAAGVGTGPLKQRHTRKSVLFSGFATHNFQARVNGFRWGYDGWIYGAGGLFGGQIHGTQKNQTWDCSGRDFRFRPETGEFESLAGVSQQGRTRDDFGNWFGNDNSTLLAQFPFPDVYTQLNPFVAPPTPRVSLARGTDPGRVFPRSRTLERFNDFGSANRLTSACGPEIYRATDLGPEYYGNAFVCEPVHNLVRRAVLEAEGPLFGARRADGEPRSEFLASSDNWFRPVEVRTGPDGALWVVDFYRFVVEHPRWIPAERLKNLDPRAGAGRGRIYRVAADRSPPRKLPNVRQAAVAELAAHLASDAGPLRDLADREVRRRLQATRRGDGSAPPLSLAAVQAALPTLAPAALVQWEWLRSWESAASGVPAGTTEELHHPDPRVRRALLPLLEAPPGVRPVQGTDFAALADDADAGVRYQFALTVGRLQGPSSSSELVRGMLPRLVRRELTNSWQRAAVVAALGAASSADLLEVVRRSSAVAVPAFSADVWRTVAGRGDVELCQQVTELRFPGGEIGAAGAEAEAFRWYGLLAAVPGLMERLTAAPTAVPAWTRWASTLRNRARPVLLDAQAPLESRLAAGAVLGQERTAESIKDLVNLLGEPLPAAVHEQVLAALRPVESSDVPAQLLSGWATLGPAARAERLGLLFSREAFQRELLGALERGEVAAADLSPGQRQTWLTKTSPDFRARAAKVLPPTAANRAAVVAAYADIDPTRASPEQGLPVFEKNCSACHRLRGIGHAVGPDLTTFRAKPVADFVQAIFDPNSAIEPRFTAQIVELRDGRTLTGIVDGESTAGFTLRPSGGGEEAVARRDIRRISAAERSLMPEGLEQVLTRDEVAALIQWLRSTPAPFGGTGVAAGLVAQRELTTQGVSRVRRMTVTEPVLPYASWLSPLPLRYCRQTDGRSRAQWEARALPGSTPGRQRFRFAVAAGLVSQPAGSFRLRVHDQAEVLLEATVEDAAWSSTDGRVRARYAVREQNAEDSCGILEIELESGGSAGAGDWIRFELTGGAAASQRWFGLYEVPGTWD